MAPTTEQPVPGRKRKIIAWTVIVFIGFLVLAAALKPEPVKVNGFTPPDPPAVQAAAKAKASSAKPANVQIVRAAAGAQTLRRASKDPESFEMKSIVTHPDGAVCFDYRAKNSFNAMLAGSAVIDAKGALLIEEQHGNRFVSAWNKSCTKNDGDDVMDIVNRVISMAS